MKKSFSLSVFVFLIATMMLSFSIDHRGLSLLDIQKASAFISREGRPPSVQLSTSLPLPTITGSDIGMSGPTPSPLQQPSNIGNNDNDNANPLIQPNSIKGESVAAEVKSKGADTIHIYNHAIKGFAIRVPNEHSLSAIENNPGVEFVEPDQRMTIFGQVLPTGVARVDGAPSSTKYRDETGTVNTGIAIIDTGIDLTHPDLNVYRDTTFVPGTISGNDDNGHGTHVAGIAAAKNNNIGVVGIAPGARLWAVKVLDSTGFGDISNIIAGIDYVTQHANEIGAANLSFGCQCHSNALDIAIHNSVAAGITYVVAAGNSASNAIDFSPANNPDVIAVSAIVDTDGRCGGLGPSTPFGNDDTFARFSNYGPVVAMAAPGVKIYSTYKDSSYATLSGTSMASPHVAGAAALYKATHIGASPSIVKQALISSGSTPSTVCDGKGYGYFSGEPGNTHEPLLDVRNY
jgi:subtilisin